MVVGGTVVVDSVVAVDVVGSVVDGAVVVVVIFFSSRKFVSISSTATFNSRSLRSSAANC